jgi:hypothetical protein
MSGNPEFVYSKDDLQAVKDDIVKFAQDRKVGPGLSTYVTNFDTEFEHIIPEYARALKQELYTPIERRILGGLGLIEVVEGISSTRKESIMNPKPFFSEVKTAIDDFKAMILDIVYFILKNNSQHRKYVKNEIKLRSTLVTEKLNDKIMTQYRSGYDRGVISKRTYAEILGIDLDVEVQRREAEKKDEDTLYPPVTQNLEQNTDEESPIKKENVPDDKKGLEKKNFNQAEEGKIVKKKDGWYVLSEDNKNLGGPYKTKKQAVKRLKQVEYFKNKGEYEHTDKE